MACSVRAAFGSRVSLTRRPSLARRVCRQTVLTVPLLVRAMATGECPVRGIAAQLRVEGHTPSHTTRPTRRVATGSAGMELDKNTPEEVRRGRASSPVVLLAAISRDPPALARPTVCPASTRVSSFRQLWACFGLMPSTSPPPKPTDLAANPEPGGVQGAAAEGH